MPGTNGIELARILQSTNPQLRVLFMSGYSEEAIQTRGNLVQETNFVSKPITISELLNKIAELI